MDYIGALERALGKKATMEMLPLQAGDVPDTFADVDDLVKEFGYKPKTPVDEGIRRFVAWYREYFKV
jgi:UDP-glucuronate 4-epimerase